MSTDAAPELGGRVVDINNEDLGIAGTGDSLGTYGDSMNIELIKDAMYMGFIFLVVIFLCALPFVLAILLN